MLVNILAADGKHCLVKRDNLTIPIQMQLRRKQQLFLNLLLPFLNAAEVLSILAKKMMLIDFVISKLRTPKMWSDKCLKCSVSEGPSTTDTVNVPSTVEICITAAFSDLFTTARLIKLEKVSLIDMPNLGTACSHIGCR